MPAFHSLIASLRRRLIINSSRVHLEAGNQAFAAEVPAGSLVLDAGAGNCQYRPLFNHARYESADFGGVDKRYGELTYVCDLTAIPVENERFDYVLFNQTLEHLPQPGAVLQELARVLKPGGTIYCTAPFYYEEHEQPYDFYRYTQFGQRYLFTEAGFDIISIEWLEGYWGTLAYQLDLGAQHLSLSARDYGGGVVGYLTLPAIAVTRIMFVLMAAALFRLDLRNRFTRGGHPKNYAVLARKPAKS